MSLSPEWRIGDLDLTEWPFAVAFGSDYGAPDYSPEVLTSFLTDGDLELTARVGNRTLTLPVLIEGADMAALAEAEAALVRECDKPLNTLYVDPGDGKGEPFRFTVFRGQVTFQRDDDYEQAGYHLFQVVWRAEPWPEADAEISATLTTSNVGSARQQIGTFVPKGSVAASGSLSVQHASSGLGEVLVYTCPGTAVPACRDYVNSATASAAVTDSSTVSGKYNEARVSDGKILFFDVPYSNVPDGDYLVMIRALAVSADCLVNVTSNTLIGGTVVSPSVSSTEAVSIPTTAEYRYYRLGVLHLPTVAVGGTTPVVRLALFNDSANILRVDELYLFNLTDGRLSQLACGSGAPPYINGGPNNRLWIDSPSVDNDGRGLYLMGTAADRSDSYSALSWAESPSVHDFPASGVTVFVVTPGTATAPAITYRYRPAGHSSVYSGV